MKIQRLLILALILTAGSKSHSCGTSYPLPSGSTEPASVAFSPDGSYLATCNEGSNDITLFALSGGIPSGGISHALPAGSRLPYSISFSPNGSYLATANQNSNDVTLFNTACTLPITPSPSFTQPPRALQRKLLLQHHRPQLQALRHIQSIAVAIPDVLLAFPLRTPLFLQVLSAE